MKLRGTVFALWLMIIGILVASLLGSQDAAAQSTCGGPGQPPCPPSSGGKKKYPPLKLPTPTSTIIAQIETWAAETATARPSATPTATSRVIVPRPVVPPTEVAGPVFLRPGVINVIIIVALIGLLAGALILVTRGIRPPNPNKPPNPNMINPGQISDAANQSQKAGFADGTKQFDKTSPLDGSEDIGGEQYKKI